LLAAFGLHFRGSDQGVAPEAAAGGGNTLSFLQPSMIVPLDSAGYLIVTTAFDTDLSRGRSLNA